MSYSYGSPTKVCISCTGELGFRHCICVTEKSTSYFAPPDVSHSGNEHKFVGAFPTLGEIKSKFNVVDTVLVDSKTASAIFMSGIKCIFGAKSAEYGAFRNIMQILLPYFRFVCRENPIYKFFTTLHEQFDTVIDDGSESGKSVICPLGTAFSMNAAWPLSVEQQNELDYPIYLENWECDSFLTQKLYCSFGSSCTHLSSNPPTNFATCLMEDGTLEGFYPHGNLWYPYQSKMQLPHRFVPPIVKRCQLQYYSPQWVVDDYMEKFNRLSTDGKQIIANRTVNEVICLVTRKKRLEKSTSGKRKLGDMIKPLCVPGYHTKSLIENYAGALHLKMIEDIGVIFEQA